jgi:prepilin-type N-terminal cleavage/methylation domain-containing protein
MNNRGFSLVEIVISVAIMAILSLAGLQSMEMIYKTKVSMLQQNSRDSILVIYRSLIHSKRALETTRISPSNPKLTPCFRSQTNTSPSQCIYDKIPIQLLASDGTPMIPSPNPTPTSTSQAIFVNDGGKVCDQANNDPSCQWAVSATLLPNCNTTSGLNVTGQPCQVFPSSFTVDISLNWQPLPTSTATPGVAKQMNNLTEKLPMEAFYFNEKPFTDISTCPTGTYAYSTDQNGEPMCTPVPY